MKSGTFRDSNVQFNKNMASSMNPIDENLEQSESERSERQTKL